MSKGLELLEKIATNTSSSIDPVWIALITGGTAVLTALITVGATLITSKRNQILEKQKLLADVVTKERLRWLQELRALASNNYVHLDLQYNLLKRKVEIDKNEFQAELDGISKKIMGQSNDIILMLNKSDPAQAKVFDAVQDAQSFILSCVANCTLEAQCFNDQQYGEIKNTFFNAMSDIGNETWEQIKTLS